MRSVKPMDDITIVEYEKKDLSNSMLVVAFPTVGLISSIAGRYIIDFLKLEPIGAITSRYFMPATVIHKSRPFPPVRIYAGKKICGVDGSCDQLVVIISEFMPPWDIVKPMVDKILSWSKKNGCKIIVTFEGTHVSDTKNLKVYGVASTPAMKQTLKQYGIEEVKEGMITGDSGVLLYEGVLQNRDVLCLLAEAHASYPDSRAAGMLLETLDKMLPEITIDLEPLYKEADEIEKRIREFLKQAKPTAPSVAPLPSTMYG